MAKRRLGRGLDSLIAPGPTEDQDPVETVEQGTDSASPAPAGEAEAALASSLQEAQPPAPAAGQIPIDCVSPNPYQPRKDFDESGLAELMQSISANGIIQPLVVRPRPGGRFELVAGERRLRAAQALGLATVPAVVREVADERMLEMALIENIQRADLNPIEKAEAFRDFLGRYHLTQEEASQRIGMERATLANHLRLLELPDEIQTLVRRGALGMSHARTIAGVADETIQMSLAKKVIRQGWSVRQLERTVAGMQRGPRRRSSGRQVSAEAAALENELRGLLGTKVQVEESAKRGSGRIVIEYYNLDDVDRIMSIIRR